MGFLSFLAVCLAVPTVFLVLQRLLAPPRTNEWKEENFECGNVPKGSPWLRHPVQFYAIALMFLVFDVEVVVLYPWAVHVRELGMGVFWAVLFFLGLLTLALVYAWRLRALEWE